MTLDPHPRPDCRPDCFGCKVRTVAVGADSIWRQSERANRADIAAYNRMARNGEAPRAVEGAARSEWGH